MDYQLYHWFSAVVDAGSFSAAAQKLAVGKSTLSEKVAALEQHLGVDLLIRTTRKISLTDAGRRLHEACVKGLGAIDLARLEVTSRQQTPHGLLRVSAPVDMASTPVTLALTRAIAPWKDLRIEVDFSDRIVDLVAEHFDLAIRAGALPDSTLISRKIGRSAFILVASPQYLKKEGNPLHLSDLSGHRCLGFTPFENTWELTSHGSRKRLKIDPYLNTNSLVSLRQLSVESVGISLLPIHLCHQSLADRTLVRVLPDWSTESGPLHLVYPKQAFLQPKVKVVLPSLLNELKVLIS